MRGKYTYVLDIARNGHKIEMNLKDSKISNPRVVPAEGSKERSGTRENGEKLPSENGQLSKAQKKKKSRSKRKSNNSLKNSEASTTQPVSNDKKSNGQISVDSPVRTTPAPTPKASKPSPKPKPNTESKPTVDQKPPKAKKYSFSLFLDRKSLKNHQNSIIQNQ